MPQPGAVVSDSGLTSDSESGCHSQAQRQVERRSVHLQRGAAAPAGVRQRSPRVLCRQVTAKRGRCAAPALPWDTACADINSTSVQTCQEHRAQHAQGHADRLHLRLQATAVPSMQRRCWRLSTATPSRCSSSASSRRRLEQAALSMWLFDKGNGRRFVLRPAALQWRLSVATEGTALVVPSFSCHRSCRAWNSAVTAVAATTDSCTAQQTLVPNEAAAAASGGGAGTDGSIELHSGRL